MQTFLPYADFDVTARVLDQKRLGKQRVETLQLLLQLCSLKLDYPDWEPRLGGWNHPAAAMWAGHEKSLLKYQEAICQQWSCLGFADTCLEKSKFVLTLMSTNEWTDAPPPWLGDERLHKSHRSNLKTKDPVYYGSKFTDPAGVPYFWPTTEIPLQTRKMQTWARAKMLFEC